MKERCGQHRARAAGLDGVAEMFDAAGAARGGLSFYDATYVALAETLDCPLITADRRLTQRARATGRVRLLGKD